MNTRWLSLTLVTLMFGSFVSAADWPQFRGPKRDGVSTETGLLKSWPKEGPKLAWSFKNAGLGFSSFAVVDGVVFTLGSRGDDEIVLALDAAKGTELWTAKIGPVVNVSHEFPSGDGPRSTPTINGKHLYALGSQGIVVCVDIAKGTEVWRKNLVKELGGEMMTSWGFSESLLVDGEHLICTPGGPKGTLAALEKNTGKLVWQSSELKRKAPYSSIMAADFHGVRQYVQMSYIDDKEGGFVNGVAAKDGKLLWSVNLFKKHSFAMAPTPLIKDNFVYVTTGYGGGCHLFEIGKDQQPTEKYSTSNQKSVKNTHGGVVLVGNHVYGHSEGLGWVCQDFLKGDVLWNERNELNSRSGATTAADGMLYLFTEDGSVGLAQANPDEFKLVSSFSLPEKSAFPELRKKTSRSAKPWAYPVVANGMLLVRDAELIFCYDIKK